MAWYVDTSAFLKLIVREKETAAARRWLARHGPAWSSELLRTEALRTAARLGIAELVVEQALAAFSLVVPAVSTFRAAGLLGPPALRSLDALHLATALELAGELEGVVTYDRRMMRGAEAAGVPVVTPEAGAAP